MSPAQNSSDEAGGGFPRTKDGVPIWDGSSESFQGYAEAARLFEQTTQFQKRYLCGPRLQAELTGAAKRLVIGQSADWLSYGGEAWKDCWSTWGSASASRRFPR